MPERDRREAESDDPTQRLIYITTALLPQRGLYVIWSDEKQAWWRPNSYGYSPHLHGAGRYTLAEAAEICVWSCERWTDRQEGGMPPEVMTLAPEYGEDLGRLPYEAATDGMRRRIADAVQAATAVRDFQNPAGRARP